MSDDPFADYRRGLESGRLQSATPNAVREMLDEIERLKKELKEARHSAYWQFDSDGDAHSKHEALELWPWLLEGKEVDKLA